MNIIRLYYPDSIAKNAVVLLTKEHAHYIVNVMRLKIGSNVSFFNVNGEWLSEIVSLEKNKVEVKFLKKIKNSKSDSIEIELAFCLVKKHPVETILQKATELGVTKITPLVSDRSEVKELNIERANKIIVEATEQSNQLNPPQINKVIKLRDFLKNNSEGKLILFADVNTQKKLKVNDFANKKKISILIGPEGDFTPAERELILSLSNLTPFSLSTNILRADTAAIIAISLVNFINNDH